MTASWCGRRAASAISLQPKSRQATCSTSPVPDEKVACVLDHSDNQQNSTTVQPLEDAHHPSFQHRQLAIARSSSRRDAFDRRGVEPALGEFLSASLSCSCDAWNAGNRPNMIVLRQEIPSAKTKAGTRSADSVR